jgi:cytochrome c oxidase subunit II
MLRQPAGARSRRLLPAALALLAACDGSQSALSPAGRDAEKISTLFWWMMGGALVIWALVMGLALYAILFRSRRHDPRKTRLLIIGGGALFPTIVLGFLLVLGLRLLPDLLDPGADDGGPRVHVSGEQWWWRVTYELDDGARFELANELRLPVGRRTPLFLESPDVIHSLWVPSLAGKIDMIPGRVNRMALEPTRTGVFRGACAEYCGSSHAKMALHVIVLEPEEFEAWARAQRQPARSPAPGAAARGAELFALHGCGACHKLRGTSADGVIGPDLTHVGSRHAIGAGTVEAGVEGLVKWLSATGELKPGVRMPSFDMLSEGDLTALATYLDGLR